MIEDEYISVTDIEIDNDIDDNIDNNDKKLLSVYQFQPSNGSCNVIKIGKFDHVPTIFLNEFNLTESVKCTILLQLYSKSDIESYTKSGRKYYPLQKIVSDSSEKHMVLSFVPGNNIKLNGVTEGRFVLSLYTLKSRRDLEEWSIYPDSTTLLKKIIDNLIYI